MSDGKIPIFDSDGVTQGEVRWSGTMASGKWRFVPDKKIDEFAGARIKKQLKGLQQSREDLKFIGHRSPSGVSYNGWSGFTGLLGALDAAAPAVGLFVNLPEVVWPEYTVPKRPVDYDEKNDSAIHAEQKDRDDALNALELLDFRRSRG